QRRLDKAALGCGGKIEIGGEIVRANHGLRKAEDAGRGRRLVEAADRRTLGQEFLEMRGRPARFGLRKSGSTQGRGNRHGLEQNRRPSPADHCAVSPILSTVNCRCMKALNKARATGLTLASS